MSKRDRLLLLEDMLESDSRSGGIQVNWTTHLLYRMIRPKMQLYGIMKLLVKLPIK